MTSNIKIFLVSDPTCFALTDVYHGYQKAMDMLKIPYESFPYHGFNQLLQPSICSSLIHSSALIKEKGFTHIMFVGGLNIPDFIFRNLYHLKSIVTSTEDPHSFDPMKVKLEYIDYYFTNERSIANSGKYSNVHYCPTAGCNFECGKIPKDQLDTRYHSDIVFVGALYPNRQKILESIIPFIKANNINLKICGHAKYMPRTSPLWEFVFDSRTVPHHETISYYNGAKIVLNMLRDIHWNPRTKSLKNPNNKSRFSAESLNPRAYEVPLCQAFTLLEDTRPEARDIFNENEVGFFSDGKSLEKSIEYYLANDKLRDDMTFAAHKKVALNHTYTHRLLNIINVIQKDML